MKRSRTLCEVPGGPAAACLRMTGFEKTEPELAVPGPLAARDGPEKTKPFSWGAMLSCWRWLSRKERTRPCAAACLRVADLKRQSQRPGAVLPACGGWARKNKARPLGPQPPACVPELSVVSYQLSVLACGRLGAAAMKFLLVQPLIIRRSSL
jgi:hypothetical protein